MKYIDCQFYVEVKDHRYRNHATESNNSRKRNPPQSLRPQYQVQNETQFRRNEKVIQYNNNEKRLKIILKNKQPIIHQPKPKPSTCPRSKRNN